MDKKKGIQNVAVSVFFRILLLIANLFARRFLIEGIGNEANGIDSLYTSIMGFLAVAELGVGSAITFCMYKPIVEGDTDKVSALFGLFRKLYLIIAGIFLVVGCAVMPLVPTLAKGYSFAVSELYITYMFMLISVALSYVFSAEISLINAYKNNYISTSIQSGGQLLQYILQIVVLLTTQSLILYFSCRILAILVQWGITEIISQKKYKFILTNKQKVDAHTKREVTKNVKALFMHKIGGVLVNTADSLIISAFIGVVVLGRYSNYTVIVTAMAGTISLFFTPLTSVIGHMFVEESKESVTRYCNFFHTFNFVIGIIFFLGYYAVIDNLVTLFFGAGMEEIKAVSFVITLNYFIQFMRQAVMLFRDATGTFYYDRWKPLAEGVINVVLSIAFVYLFGYFFGAEFAVVGVIAATIITNLGICHIVEPYVLFKHAFGQRPKRYYLRNYAYIAVFAAALCVLNLFMRQIDNQWLELLVNGCISVGISFVVVVAVLILNQDFRHYLKKIFRRKTADDAEKIN